MAKDFYTSPRLGVYDHKPHVDLLYNTNLHVDPTEINTYLAFFIIASFVLFVSCIMFYKKVYKRILDIIIMSLIYFSLNYSIKIWAFLYSFVVIPYYSAYNSTLYYSNLIIGISFVFNFVCYGKKK